MSTNISTPLQSEFTRVGHLLADAAEVETLRFFRADHIPTHNKASDKGSVDSATFDPVTCADKAAENAMRECLATLRPDDGIIGEEFGHTPSQTGFTWVLDPIDGTRGYMSGTPTWGTLIGLFYDNKPVFGLIAQPFLKERFIGAFGKAHLQSHNKTQPLCTRKTVPLNSATLMTTFPEVGTAYEKAAFDRVAADARTVRYSMDCYAYALLALGQVDLIIEAGLQCYDIAAPIAVIEAAGGVVTDWSGQRFHNGIPENARLIAAGSQTLHAEALERLNTEHERS